MTSELSLFIFCIVFVLVITGLTVYIHIKEKDIVGELHIYSNGEGEPPTWSFNLKKDLDINSITDIKYATFKVIKEE